MAAGLFDRRQTSFFSPPLRSLLKVMEHVDVELDIVNLKEGIAFLSISGFLQGVHALLFCLCIRIQWMKTFKKFLAGPSAYIFATMAVSFILSSAVWILSITSLIAESHGFPPNSFPSINCIGGIVMLLNELLILWRAKCLWNGRRLVLIVPSLFAASASVLGTLSIIFLFYMRRPDAVQQPQVFRYFQARTVTFAAAAFAMLLMSNFVSSSLILCTIRRHNKSVDRTTDRRTSSSLSTLIIIVETGFAFAIFQIVMISFNIYRFFTLSEANDAFEAAYRIYYVEFYLMAGMFPSLLYVVINHERAQYKA